MYPVCNRSNVFEDNPVSGRPAAEIDASFRGGPDLGGDLGAEAGAVLFGEERLHCTTGPRPGVSQLRYNFADDVRGRPGGLPLHFKSTLT
jgi:hypothetical protein